MNNYVTGKMIKELREKKKMTQSELASILLVSDKTISKWETGKGLPDITLLEPLAKALEISLIELMQGNTIVNKNKSVNMFRSTMYVCPICGNAFHSFGEATISCCGVNLMKEEAIEEDEHHQIEVEMIEDDYAITLHHAMSKTHYISFIVYVTCDRFEMVKLYPESSPEARFLNRGKGYIYAYCNQDGLIKKKL